MAAAAGQKLSPRRDRPTQTLSTESRQRSLARQQPYSTKDAARFGRHLRRSCFTPAVRPRPQRARGGVHPRHHDLGQARPVDADHARLRPRAPRSQRWLSCVEPRRWGCRHVDTDGIDAFHNHVPSRSKKSCGSSQTPPNQTRRALLPDWSSSETVAVVMLGRFDPRNFFRPISVISISV